MDVNIKSSCNWNHIGGCALAVAIQTKLEHEDGFIKPELSEILNDDKAILFGKPTIVNESEQCELRTSLFPRYKIDALTLICSAVKVELFLGAQKEYYETVYGTNIVNDNDNHEVATEQQFCRYDIELHKSGVTELNIKFLTNADELIIYGMQLQIAPNPNGITTLLSSAIDLNNVQQMLQCSSKKLSPSAEKCKSFMEMWQKQTAATATPANAAASLLEQYKLLTLNAGASNETVNANVADMQIFQQQLQQYVDEKLQALEANLNMRLLQQHAEQMQKLEQILDKLSNQKLLA